MKNISRIIGGLLFVMLLCTATSSRAQYWLDDCGGTGSKIKNNNAGQEFLLCYMQNELSTDEDINATYQDVYLAALDEVGDDDSVVIALSCKAFPNYKDTVKLAKRGSLTYPISRILSRFVLIYSNEVVDDMVVRVTSSHPIVCYGMNHKKNTADAFLALPRNVAETDYMVMSYPNSKFPNEGPRQSEFCVAAFDDSTIVEITPTSTTLAGSLQGVKLTFILDAGQCVQIQASDIPTNDLTGSRVHSNKPIVVYGGHIRAEVPSGYSYGAGSTSRDHLCEAIPPNSSWGKYFVCNQFFNPDVVLGDVVRVLARDNNTTVKINGVAQGAILNSGEHTDIAILGPLSIETSEPSLVGMFAHTTSFSQGVGDPFFAIIPPVDQTYNDYTFFVSQDLVYSITKLLVVTEKSGIGAVKLNGISIDTITFKLLPGTLNGKEYAVGIVDGNLMQGGANRITTPYTEKGKGITILAYGFGAVDSYGYTAGSLLQPLQGIIADDFTFAGVPPGEAPPSEVRFMSMLNEKVWLDSAVVTEISNPRYSVRTKKSLPYDISYLTGGQKMAVELEVFPPTDEVLFGMMQVHHHTTEWRGMRPAKVPFVIYPKQTASVNTDEYNDRSVTVYPNPVLGDKGSVTLRVDRSTTAKIRLFDATGREVLSMAPRQINSREETLNFSTRGLASGSYVLELSMLELNRTERRHIIIQK